MSPEASVGVVPNGDLEILVRIQNGTYQMDWEHSYRNEVFNAPVDVFSNFVYGRRALTLGRHKLLFGITLNGVCPADCLDCPFGRSVLVENKATPVTPAELNSALMHARHIALREGILKIDEGFSAGALLSGDPGYSRYTADLIAVVSQFPMCEACRWSTIAPKTGHNVLKAFEQGAKKAKDMNPSHVPSFQVSLHSTDHSVRMRHTGVRDLLSMEDIAQASRQIKEITGRKMSLSFVLHEGSVIDTNVLKAYFSPEHNLISLRPVYSSTTRPMNSEKLIDLYSSLRVDGWDVVYMPPSMGNGLTSPPIELHNMRAVQL